MDKYVDNNQHVWKTIMKITILTPKSEFAKAHQLALSKIGTITYTDSRRKYSLEELSLLAQKSDILAVDPDNLGGFELAPDILPKLLHNIPSIKCLALSTTSYGYIDKNLYKSRGVRVSNIPHYSSESVAEHSIALLLGCAKRIFISDRRAQKGIYKLEKGVELAGKTLGIIGLGSIGTRTAELGLGLGMKVVAYNRTPKKVKGIKMATLNKVLETSDFISIHLIDGDDTFGFISGNQISKMKRGVIIVNTSSRNLIDEQKIASALKNGKVDSYALEVEDINSKPLGILENAFLFKGFGWYTKEALERNKEIWVNNIIGMVNHKYHNLVK